MAKHKSQKSTPRRPKRVTKTLRRNPPVSSLPPKLRRLDPPRLSRHSYLSTPSRRYSAMRRSVARRVTGSLSTPTTSTKGLYDVARTLSSAPSLNLTPSRPVRKALDCARRTIRKEVILASGRGGRNGQRRYKKSGQRC